MKNEWDEYADGWDTNPDVMVYADRAFASLQEAVVLEGLRILDFGCGTGLLTEKMSPLAARVVGLDTSQEMVAVLGNKGLFNVDVIGDGLSAEIAERPACLSHPFDLVVASSVCGFLPDYAGTLLLLGSLLKSGGTFVQWDWLASGNSADPGLTAESIREAFEKAGLEIQSLSTPFSMMGAEDEMTVLMGVGRQP